MRLIPSDPDIATIARRIRDGDLDLQPNFQRGEVWTTSKKQKLVDSILREWHVPPVHVIQGVAGGKDEVLDGQQRLAAIRDFLDDKLKISGTIEPFDEEIVHLDGLRFADLSEEWKRKIKRFPIRVFSIVDYKPSEPSELFYRLNQPSSLTAAEQRNSFFGKPREQIKELVKHMEDVGLQNDFLGFSNSRMAYDDALARVCVALEKGLATKTGATLLADRYRSGIEFDSLAYNRAKKAIDILAEIRGQAGRNNKLNKASLFSWLIFLCRTIESKPAIQLHQVALFFNNFENDRMMYALGSESSSHIEAVRAGLYDIYADRVTSRVADVSSVILRDLALWGLYVTDQRFMHVELSQGFFALKSFLFNLRESGKSRMSEGLLIEFMENSPFEWEVLA
ncbi:Hypothetical protein HEAR0699 [Herminiimonas arsenicoxydans]|uniref:GmrSD restriction endonucleases N-terminal domain-containing protein n=1 Tax=Herminiimonas arsenicoxydans TaxID=204773 RepID=A4G306_HERAR|nr:Hypothetical protein HEAR0699 [Herminiimonas arsenicoxydans]